MVDSCARQTICCRKRGRYAKRSDTKDDNSYEEYEDTLISYPKNVIDVKVKTSNLIIKRFDNPWDNYEEVEDLGCGTFGLVKKVILKSRRDFRAMKIINKSNVVEGVDNSEILNEFNILRNLDHPNIMKIYEFYEDKDNYYLITEFFDQGDLYNKLVKLKYMTEVIVKFLMSQILNAVAYLHSKKILHGDIKMENILLYTTQTGKGRKRFTILSKDTKNKGIQKEMNNFSKKRDFSPLTKSILENMTNYEIKLIDFGCSKIFNKKKNKTLSGIIGTSMYCSPEVVDDKYDEKSDEWACGVLMYILLSGSTPFQGITEEEIFSNIKKGKFNFNKPEFKYVSDNCKDLICNLLEYYPEDRISAFEALQHPFFTENFNPNLALTHNKDLSILTNLLHVKTIGKFQETIVAYLTINFIDKDEEKKLREIFRYMDTQSKNYLNINDFRNCLKSNDYDISDEEIKHIIGTMDSDHNGHVEYQEFLRTLCDKDKLFSEDNLKCAFNYLDEEKKGIIVWDNINKIIFHNKDLKSELIDEYLSQIGISRDDQIDFNKFCYIMKLAK